MARQVVCDEEKSSGYGYADVSSSMQTHLANQIQGFVSDPEMYNLATGIEMIGFPKNINLPQHTDTMWKTFIPKPPPPSNSSKNINDSSSTNFFFNNKPPPNDFSSPISETATAGDHNHNLIVGAHDSATWQDNGNNRTMLVDDSSSLRCVSLSLNSNNPSSLALQSFELRQQQQQQQTDFVSSSSRSSSQQQQQILLQDGYFLLKNSKYLIPAHELLNEFCSLGVNENEIPKQQKNKNWEEDSGDGSGSSKSKHSLTSLELIELQKRKTKLLSMLEEVDRRYRHYRNQMKGVVASFEAVAGKGAARVYSALALKAMSRHFRCLKDGIMAQVEATRKAMGERDAVAPGTTRGETPRLKMIDQALRQQRAFQQMSMMETHPWRPQRGLPERSVSLLRAWLFEHFLHPYPSDVDKHILARQTGLSRSQVSNWFINARVRLWKPMVEEMYLEEVKERDRENNNNASLCDNGGGGDDEDDDINPIIQNPAFSPRLEDQKPNPDTLIRNASSMIINHTSQLKINPKGNTKSTLHMNQHVTDAFIGSMELDFSSYVQNSSEMMSFASNDDQQNMNGGVSLTLGLQQHGEVSLAFPPPPQNHHNHQSSLLYQTREEMEECQTVQYSLLDNGEGQNRPYRNLMGAQLLHDLAG